ncbi:MAG: hypothetical protein JWO66_388, partial [Candidatus Eremiobacteraeota bacterium]|nr:hypothetical protein [Candidatus Eremiobacteraeota bacterium]
GAKRARLRKMKTIATSLLGAMAVVFIVSSRLKPAYPFLAWVEAFSEAALIGERFNARRCDAAGSVLLRFQQQFSLLITEIVQRWVAAEITEKIEIDLGLDLQFMRLNGSLVGGAAGVVLHAALVVTGAAV